MARYKAVMLQNQRKKLRRLTLNFRSYVAPRPSASQRTSKKTPKVNMTLYWGSSIAASLG
eukprot:1536158-Ditylum_brightwellii.AAC.1